MPEHAGRKQRCIDDCLQCHRICLSMAMGQCLEQDGEQTAPTHFRLLMSCAEVCIATAHLMMMESSHHRHLCSECAEICLECAADCEGLSDMSACVAACRTCAESCLEMAA